LLKKDARSSPRKTTPNLALLGRHVPPFPGFSSGQPGMSGLQIFGEFKHRLGTNGQILNHSYSPNRSHRPITIRENTVTVL
jgi:hypothetical protein